jgi:hypothetical protein
MLPGIIIGILISIIVAIIVVCNSSTKKTYKKVKFKVFNKDTPLLYTFEYDLFLNEADNSITFYKKEFIDSSDQRTCCSIYYLIEELKVKHPHKIIEVVYYDYKTN